MSQLHIVVDSLEDWAPYQYSENLLSASEYLELAKQPGVKTRVINLCKESWLYLSQGYYVSLLAEARGHSTVPAAMTLTSLSDANPTELALKVVDDRVVRQLNRMPENGETSTEVEFFFGRANRPGLDAVGRLIFEMMPFPMLRAELKYDGKWKLKKLFPLSLHQLNDESQSAFADALDSFSKKIWRSPKQKRPSRFDMAILCDPEEKLPPSDKKALDKFVQAGRKKNVDIELITAASANRLGEFDMLFIRQTTAINHVTFELATRAWEEGLVVIDDPVSIVRCTNKLFLMELFARHRVPTPASRLIHRASPQTLVQAGEELGYPLIVKIPDGSFSRGILKIESSGQLHLAKELFKTSELLLAQEYLYTNFDWRIGVLNGKPLYACQYFMARNHWQIYNHSANRFSSGGFKTIPTYEAPKSVVQAAVKAAGLIGNGLYGVDLKQIEDRVVVIEVNDNPSIESGVEDAFLKDELYSLIIEEFIERAEQQLEEHPTLKS
jgi:glutathione synthase/RimK-type ligase-like ATP-grasp enzyme